MTLLRQGPYSYDDRTMRYRDRHGRFVSSAQGKAVVNASFDRGANRARELARRLQRREITLSQWQTEMMRETKNAALYGQALANGGWENLSPADYGRVGRWLAQGPAGGRGQYQYLREFARQIENGLPLDGRFVERSAMYVRSGNVLFERERGRTRVNRGFSEVRSIRHAKDSCGGCVDQAAKKWQKEEEYVYPGNRDCRSSCRCTSQWRNPATGDIAA